MGVLAGWRGQGKGEAGWPRSVPGPNKMCLLSQVNLWVPYRLEAGPGCSLLGVAGRQVVPLKCAFWACKCQSERNLLRSLWCMGRN